MLRKIPIYLLRSNFRFCALCLLVFGYLVVIGVLFLIYVWEVVVAWNNISLVLAVSSSCIRFSLCFLDSG